MPKNGYVEEKKIVYEKKKFWRESIRNGLLSLQLKFEKNSLVTFVRGQEFPKSPYCSKQPPGGVWPTQKTKVFFVYSLTLALRGGGGLVGPGKRRNEENFSSNLRSGPCRPYTPARIVSHVELPSDMPKKTEIENINISISNNINFSTWIDR